jgi:hypothetical protein
MEVINTVNPGTAVYEYVYMCAHVCVYIYKIVNYFHETIIN